MLKERLNLSLNEEAARALEDLAARLKLSKTAVIEAVLAEAARRENLAAFVDRTDPSRVIAGTNPDESTTEIVSYFVNPVLEPLEARAEFLAKVKK